MGHHRRLSADENHSPQALALNLQFTCSMRSSAIHHNVLALPDFHMRRKRGKHQAFVLSLRTNYSLTSTNQMYPTAR